MPRKSQAPRQTVTSTVGLVIGLLVIVGGIGLIVISSLPAAKVAAPTPALPTQTAEETYPEIPRVELAKAKAAFDAKTAVFVDVRAGDSYAASHIPGALSIPLGEIGNRSGELKPSDWIITYCT
jgi:3-mercaptopyruvate sulfurtransferase SseA